MEFSDESKSSILPKGHKPCLWTTHGGIWDFRRHLTSAHVQTGTMTSRLVPKPSNFSLLSFQPNDKRDPASSDEVSTSQPTTEAVKLSALMKAICSNQMSSYQSESREGEENNKEKKRPQRSRQGLQMVKA
ncbi:Hypothetical predicted protein [Xyrichtys novacula]|uniref:Uncharacterized protein n=1 Tax=Xyrichtys novacula TaxID=13765 RepID=A0AAV1G5I3_XYRNO|nr:Hypothetical predicted protein [Xyrichtys novacula]